jgi:hypothetical protein
LVRTPESTIDCVDCGGRCHLLSMPREDGVWLPGDIVAYRCEDCLDRWDLVMPDEDDEAASGDGPGSLDW